MRAHLERVGSNAAALVISGVTQLVRGAVLLPIVARALGPIAFGQLSSALALVAALQPAVGPGVAPVLTSELVRSPEREASLIRGTVGRALFVAAAIWVVLGVWACFCLPVRQRVIVICLGSTLVATAWMLTGCSLSARLRDDRTLLAQIAASLTLIVGTGAAILGGCGVVGVAAATAIGALVQAAVCARFARRMRPTADAAPAASIYRRAAPSIGVSFAVAAMVTLDIVAVERLSGAAEAGNYAAASRLLLMLLIVPQALAGSLVPAFAVGGAMAHRRCLNAAAMLATLGIPLAAFAPLYAVGITRLLGASYAGAAAIVLVLAWRVAGMFIATCFDTYLIATSRQRSVLGCHIAGAAVALFGYAMLIPRFGGIGAAWSVCAGEAVKLIALAGCVRVPIGRALRAAGACGVNLALAFALAIALPGGWALRTTVAGLAFVLLGELFAAVSPIRWLLRFRSNACA